MMDMQAITITLVGIALMVLLVVLWRLHGIHTLVNSRLTIALNKSEQQEAEIERLGGAKAPPRRGPDDK